MPGKLRNRRVRPSSCAALWTTTKRRLRLMPSTGRPMPDAPLALRLSALLRLCWAAAQQHHARSVLVHDGRCQPASVCSLERHETMHRACQVNVFMAHLLRMRSLRG